MTPTPAPADAVTDVEHVIAAGRHDDMLHALHRTTAGPRSEDFATVRRLGWRNWVETQLAPETIADPEGDRIRSWFPRLDWSTQQVMDAVRDGEISRGTWDIMHDLTLATVGQRVWSSRQLFELMVEFWSDHLNVACPSSDVWGSRQVYDRLVREHALGTFADLLVATGLSHAMAVYLDNAQSKKGAPNENYSRELLELHTVGIGHYTEADVQAGARLLTGWRVPWPEEILTYEPYRHDTGAVTVLDFSVPEHAAEDGRLWQERYLRWLAMRPETARRISRKLCVRFVSDNPPAELVARMTQTWLQHDSAIKPVLRTLFCSPEFWQSKQAKVRRPFEDLAATLRTLGCRPDDATALQQLGWLAQEFGHPPLGWSQPDGYPDVAVKWQSAGSQAAMWHAHMSIVAQWWPKGLGAPDTAAITTQLATGRTFGEFVDALAHRLLFRSLSEHERAGVLQLMDRTADQPVTSRDRFVRWATAYPLAMILYTPTFRMR